MRKLITFLLTFVILASSFGQENRKVSVYAFFQINKTLYDRTPSNNPGGFGGSMQVLLNNRTKFKPVLEAGADAFGGTKEMYFTSEGVPIYAKDNVYTVLVGSTYQPFSGIFAGCTAGPAFLNAHTYIAVRPVIGFYLSKNKRWAFKSSLTHILQRDDISGQPFGYMNFSAGLRLF